MLKIKQRTMIYQTRKTRKGQYVKSCQWDWGFFTCTAVQTTRAYWKYYGVASRYAVEVTNTSRVVYAVCAQRKASCSAGCLGWVFNVAACCQRQVEATCVMLRAAVRSVTCCIQRQLVPLTHLYPVDIT